MSALLVDVLEGFLGKHRKFNEDTGQVAFDCPVCSAEKNMLDGDGKGNLEVNYNIGKYKCWACFQTHDTHGSVLKLIKQFGNQKILKDYLLIKPESEFKDKKERPEIELILPEGYKKISECTGKEFKYDTVMQYLKSRGITDDIIKEYEIGFTTKGKYYNRIIVPSYNEEGKLNYFIARWFAKEYTKLKYLNPDVEKQSIIFNESKINWDATIYIVEGVTDHIVVPNSIPLLGKFISDELLEKLHDKAGSYIVVLLDDDAYDDAKVLYKKLNFCDLTDRVMICVPPTGYDPSKIHENFGKKGIINLLKSSRKLRFDEMYF
jgi:hypothetical protein